MAPAPPAKATTTATKPKYHQAASAFGRARNPVDPDPKLAKDENVAAPKEVSKKEKLPQFGNWEVEDQGGMQGFSVQFDSLRTKKGKGGGPINIYDMPFADVQAMALYANAASSADGTVKPSPAAMKKPLALSSSADKAGQKHRIEAQQLNFGEGKGTGTSGTCGRERPSHPSVEQAKLGVPSLAETQSSKNGAQFHIRRRPGPQNHNFHVINPQRGSGSHRSSGSGAGMASQPENLRGPRPESPRGRRLQAPCGPMSESPHGTLSNGDSGTATPWSPNQQSPRSNGQRHSAQPSPTQLSLTQLSPRQQATRSPNYQNSPRQGQLKIPQFGDWEETSSGRHMASFSVQFQALKGQKQNPSSHGGPERNHVPGNAAGNSKKQSREHSRPSTPGEGEDVLRKVVHGMGSAEATPAPGSPLAFPTNGKGRSHRNQNVYSPANEPFESNDDISFAHGVLPGKNSSTVVPATQTPEAHHEGDIAKVQGSNAGKGKGTGPIDNKKQRKGRLSFFSCFRA